MRAHALSLLLAAVACGSGTPAALHLAYQSQDSKTGPVPDVLTLHSGETRTIELLLVGATSGATTFTGDALPAFASLSGSLLTLAPTAADAGKHRLTLHAGDGASQASASLDVVVVQESKPPSLHAVYPVFLVDDLGSRGWVCPSQFCTVFGNAAFQFHVAEADGDQVRIEAEVLPATQPFTGSANVSATVPREGFDSMAMGMGTTLPLPALQAGVSYHFAIRVTDGSGVANTQFTQLGGGWETTPSFIFDAGPCAGRACACVPTSPVTNGDCWHDQDCCNGGRCVGSPGSCVP